MADNIIINTGTGPTIVTDQVGTGHYQVIKIALGAADTASMLPVGQQVMNDSLPVVIASNQSTLPVSVVAFTPAGTQDVAVVNTPVITASQGGTWNIATLSTVLAMPVLSASGVTIASIATGSVSIVNTPTFIGTAPVTRWNSYAVNTTSGASVILKTSGAHTLYITDMVVAAAVAGTVTILSDATTQFTAYLGVNGGFVMDLTTPMVLNSNQSLAFVLSASGSCAGWASGYTVT